MACRLTLPVAGAYSAQRSDKMHPYLETVESCKLMIIEKCELDRERIRSALEDTTTVPIEFFELTSLEHLDRQAEIWKPDLVLLNDEHVGLDGLAIISNIARKYGRLPFPCVMITQDDRQEPMRQALRAGVMDYIRKDELTTQSIRHFISRSLEKAHLIKELEAKNRALQTSEEKMEIALNAARMGVFKWDISNDTLWFDEITKSCLSLTTSHSEYPAVELIRLIHPEDLESFHESIRQGAADSQFEYRNEFRISRPDGYVRWLATYGRYHPHEKGNVQFITGTLMDITDRKRAEFLAYGQSEIFRKLAQNEETCSVLSDVIVTLETQLDGVACLIMLIDPEDNRLRLGAAPSIPSDYRSAIDGLPIGPTSGLCAVAAHEKKRVIIENIATDARGLSAASLILKAGYKACWADPIFDGEGNVVATFGMYFKSVRRPTALEKKIIESGTKLASAVLERDRARKEIALRERQFRQLADSMPQIVWISDADGSVQYVNQKWTDYTGLSLLQTIEMTWMSLLHSADRQRAQELIPRFYARGESFSVEMRYRSAEGFYRWHLVSACPIRDQLTHKIQEWFGTCTDIDEIKLANDRVTESELRLSLATASAGIGVWDWNLNTDQLINTPMQWSVLQYSHPPAKFTGTEFFARVHLEDIEMVKETIFQTTSQSPDFQTDFRFLTVTGSILNLIGRGRVLFAEDGTPRRVMGVTLDVTETKALEEKLKLAKLEAERTTQIKSQFLANVSHELRSPLNSVVGYSDLLAADNTTPEEKQKYAERINSSSKHLLALINDILDLTKFESGNVRFEKNRFPLSTLLADCLSYASVLAKQKQIPLIISNQGTVPIFIETDSNRVRQILINLLSNALKFTDRGSIKIEVSCDVSEKDGVGTLVFQVIDTGMGIPESAIESLFLPFSQVDSSISRKFGGTGLGLSLSRGFAEGLGGDLILKQTKLGQGSCFRLRLPIGPVDVGAMSESLSIFDSPKPINADRAKSLRGMKILCVDDSAENLKLLEIYLGRNGAVIENAINGIEAIEKATQGNFDIVLMDVSMPVLDGLSAAKELRAAGYVTPIIVLTAFADQAEVEKSYAAGCNAHLSKPLDFKKLIEVILSVVTDFRNKK